MRHLLTSTPTTVRAAAGMSAALLSAGLLLGACSSGASQSSSGSVGASSVSSSEASALLSRHGLSGDAVAVVERLEALGGSDRPQDLMASVRPGELQLSDDQGKVSLPLPGDRFYLSVAPYAQRTHDCHFHSLTTCQGEMGGETVHLRITDSSGAVLVDKDARVNANGFVGSWLPRGTAGTVEVTSAKGRGTQPFSTSAADDATCMTTLKLG